MNRRLTRVPITVANIIVVVVAIAISGLFTGFIGSAERRTAEGEIERWQEAPFYQLPDPLPAGNSGEIVRSEQLDSIFDGAKAWRVLYHSTDVKGQDILVSGVVVAPDKPAPDGGRTVVSWGHPTTGAAQRCAPSVGIDPFDTIEGLRDLISAGYVVAATDYSGMGAAGPDSYLIGATEGHNVLDAARAARQITETGANNRLILWGHSQGGHAALFAGQLAGDYAPELDLLGVAVAAPATDLGALLKNDIGDVSGVTIASYAFEAYSSVYAADLDTILTPAGVTATPKMAALCLFGQHFKIHDLAIKLVGGYLTGDPAVVEPWATLLNGNTPGAVKLDVPLFVAQGESDTLIDPAITANFVAQEQRLGTDVTYHTIPHTGHGLVATRALPKLLEWMKTIEGSAATS